MARYPVVATGTLDLTYKEVTDLLKAREALQEAEKQFYKDRADLVNTYPMKKKDITAAEIEALYDTHVGSEPWKYLETYTLSGSTAKTGSYPTGATNITWTNTSSVFWIQNYPGVPAETPSSGYPYIFDPPYPQYDSEFGTTTLVDPKGPWLYNSARGASSLDIILSKADNYTEAYTSKGTLQNYIHHEYSEGDINYFEGFGEVPEAYNGAGGLTNFQAHMRKILGEAWNETCKEKFDAYKTAYDTYNVEYGSKAADFEFIASSLSGAWSGYKQDGGVLLFNRPGTLNSKLVKEARGLSR